MKTKRLFLVGMVGILFFSYSCEKDPNPDSNPNKYVNDWIYENMSLYYLWNTSIPANPNYELEPSDFFSSLRYKYGQQDGDRFSWIQENYVDLLNSLSGVTDYDIGFEYCGVRLSSSSNDLFCYIAYVKPGTPAYAMGLRRGDLFTKVNGTQLTASNWRSIFSDANAAAISFVDIVRVNNVVTLVPKEVKNVAKVANYAENPVYLDSVYVEGGKTIGYLVYNFFATGAGTDAYAYDKALNKAFAKFKTNGVTDLVLDFRYNNGGAMSSAVLLSSMIVPGLSTSNICAKLQYNAELQRAIIAQLGSDKLLMPFVNTVKTSGSASEPINNVNGVNLYVLTGLWTASASEMVINSLKPYMSNVCLIGVTTVGKNVASMSFYEENDPKNKWGMQPIVLKYANRDNFADFANGMAPNITVEDSNYGNMLPLGDKDEVMLKTAIQKITGTYTGNGVSMVLHAAYPHATVVGSSVEQKAWANKTIVDDERLRSLKIK